MPCHAHGLVGRIRPAKGEASKGVCACARRLQDVGALPSYREPPSPTLRDPNYSLLGIESQPRPRKKAWTRVLAVPRGRMPGWVATKPILFARPIFVN
jgi:hypothetical protein